MGTLTIALTPCFGRLHPLAAPRATGKSVRGKQSPPADSSVARFTPGRSAAPATLDRPYTDRHSDLPVVRDSHGTLLAQQEERTLFRSKDDSANTAPWQPDAAATSSVSAVKLAEIDALHRIVHACMRGDSAAWQQLVVSQHRRVYAICYRFTGSPSDAEDLTQDVFLKVYRNLQGFDPAKGAFSTWLTTLTRNLLVDHFRRTRQDRATDSLDASATGDPDGPTPLERLADNRPGQLQQVAQAELRARIQHALKQLSPELREAVILRDLQDMDYREIATVLRVPEGTVKSRISRGRAEMARVLSRSEEKVM